MGEIRQPTGGRSDFQGKDELYLRRVYIQCGFLINGNLTIYSIYVYIYQFDVSISSGSVHET